MPFVSKTRGINMMRISADVILGKKINPALLDYPMEIMYVQRFLNFHL
jgi:hypothetical protein